MHEIVKAFMAKLSDYQPMACVPQSTQLTFSLHLPYSTLFLDRLDEIKYGAVGDGCQEETGSFFSGCLLVAIRASDLPESKAATLRGLLALTRQQNKFCSVSDTDSPHMINIKCINVLMWEKYYFPHC